MPFGLILSLACHVALLLWAYGSMSAVKPPPSEQTPAISAEIITPSEFLRLKQGSETAKQLETKAKDKPATDDSKNDLKKPENTPPPPPPPAPQEVAKVEPLPPEPPKPPDVVPPPPAPPEPPKPDPIAEQIKAAPPPPPEPTPGPTPDEQKVLDQKIEDAAKKAADEAAKKKAEDEAKKKAAEAARKKLIEDAKKREEARKKALAAKNKFDPNALANLIEKAPGDAQPKALIDKDPTKKGQQAAGTIQTAKQTGKEAGTATGKDTVLSAREADLLAGMLRSQLQRCSKMPGGGGGIDTPVVTVVWHVRQDGSLDGEPVVQNPENSPLFRIAAEASVNAVRNCSPLSLPPDKYAAWSTITWDFDWPKILGLR